MKEKKRKFIKILGTELDDLVDDIEELMRLYKRRFENGEITQYVCLQNNALLENEVSCLRAFSRFTQGIDADRYGTLDELSGHVKTEFQRHLADGLFAHAVESFVERKIQKVLEYVSS
jgi:hypothetical protein